jgi:hypothetical protein
MILILCHLHDAEAIWLYQQLKRAGSPDSVAIVSVNELLYARTIRHTLGCAGVEFSIQLQSGQTLTRDELSMVINRLCYIDPVVWKQTSQVQYQYVSQEINALYMSILHSLSNVRLYNPPSASWMGGRHLSLAEWQLVGLRSGLAIPPDWPPADEQAQPDTRVLIIDDQVLGSLPDGVPPNACQQLAWQVGMPLLELQFMGGYFVNASPLPVLHHYGALLIDYLLTVPTNGTDLGHTERIAHSTIA